jgi:hypothetical protein
LPSGSCTFPVRLSSLAGLTVYLSAVLTSIIRLMVLIQTANTRTDGSYVGVALVYWTTVEVNVCIVVACIMTLNPLAKHIFPRFYEGTAVVPPGTPKSSSTRALTLEDAQMIPCEGRTDKHWADIHDEDLKADPDEETLADSESKTSFEKTLSQDFDFGFQGPPNSNSERLRRPTASELPLDQEPPPSMDRYSLAGRTRPTDFYER